jgi:copper chaperone CopZ
MNHTYDVTGMHCKSCTQKISHALRAVDGITSAEVTLNPPRARLEMSHHVPTDVLNDAVGVAGNYALADIHSAPQPAAYQEEPKESLFPLFLIVGYIAGTVALVALATGDWSIHSLMRHFMAGFFLVFSFFKLLDLKGFVEAYQTYDVLAKAWIFWAFAYPFVELALGIAYLLDWTPIVTNLATLLLMLLGAIGVLKALTKKQAIRCACLGTALNLPMTTVTLVEDLGMAGMAAIMLVLILV